MKKALIISGGDFSLVELKDAYDYVIACDKGYEYAVKMGIIPDLVIGDFDSLHPERLEDTINEAGSLGRINISRYPVEKDDTDTMLAIKAALDKGFCKIDIICALGGRLDHTLANIQALNYIAENGAIGYIISSNESLSIMKAPFDITIPYKKGKSLSLYAISDTCEGVTIKGTKYEVENITLTNSFPLGYGNEIVNDNRAIISAKIGNMLIVQSNI